MFMETNLVAKPASISLANLIVEKSVHGHVHVDELYLQYEPLMQVLKATYEGSPERDFWSAEVKHEGVRARIYFRYFPAIRMLTLDWIYLPKSLRRKNISYHLLKTMIDHFPQARSVHLLLAHGNLKAFQEGAQKSVEEKIKSTPTTRQLGKLGFTQVDFVGYLNFPKDKVIYPEIVVSKPEPLENA